MAPSGAQPLWVPLKVTPTSWAVVRTEGTFPCKFKACPVDVAVTHTYLLPGRLL